MVSLGAEKAPNVLLILTDDQGFGDVGFQGNPYLRTPHLDALAEGGIRFEHFLASSTCSPSRASLLTGRHEFRNQVTHTIEGRYLLRADAPTMAEAFQAAGYSTAIFGKWHLGDTGLFHPLRRGFDESLLIGGGAIGQTLDYWGNTMFDPHLEHNETWKPFAGYATNILVDAAIEWTASADGQPWFCYLALNAPHTPLQVADNYIEPYLAMGLPERLARFYGMIENLDGQLGLFFETLRKRGELENTIIIFLGDNGTSLGGDPQEGEFNGGLRGTKASAYQGGVRVPAVFAWEGRFPEGKVVETLAGLIDVWPTLAELCNLADAAPSFPWEGRSLAPLLHKGSQTDCWEDRFFYTHVARWPSGTPLGELPFRNSSIRNQRYSLVNGVELYDLYNDPGETIDLSAKHEKVADLMREAYLDWWESVIEDIKHVQPFLLGGEDNRSIHLTCMDWHPSLSIDESLPNWLWQQSTLAVWASGKMVDDTDGAVGGWLIDVAESGRYHFTLRKLPSAAGELGAFDAGEWRLAGCQFAVVHAVSAGDKRIDFEAEIKAGPLFLEFLIDGQRQEGRPIGAYFCRITQIVSE